MTAELKNASVRRFVGQTMLGSSDPRAAESCFSCQLFLVDYIHIIVGQTSFLLAVSTVFRLHILFDGSISIFSDYVICSLAKSHFCCPNPNSCWLTTLYLLAKTRFLWTMFLVGQIRFFLGVNYPTICIYLWLTICGLPHPHLCYLNTDLWLNPHFCWLTSMSVG